MKKIKVIICIMVGLIGCILLINRLYIPRMENKDTNTSEIVVDNTNTTTKANKSKKTTKTTKKATKKKTTKKKTTKKKTTKKKLTKMSVKATRQQMIDYAYKRVVETWGANNWDSFYQIVSHESGWNANNVNKSSGACGLFQFVPCSKGGKAYTYDYKVQIEKGIQYISYRYKTPNKAWNFWKQHHWY